MFHGRSLSAHGTLLPIPNQNLTIKIIFSYDLSVASCVPPFSMDFRYPIALTSFRYIRLNRYTKTVHWFELDWCPSYALQQEKLTHFQNRHYLVISGVLICCLLHQRKLT